MALMPKRVKRRKVNRGNNKGRATRGNTVEFGEFGLQAVTRGWLDGRQIESGRVAANHFLRGEGRIWIRVFPHKPISAKPAEVRMGTGKGDVDRWVAVIKPGTIVYEVGGVGEQQAKVALNRMAHKMPFRCRMARRRPKL